jgi:hypothetical protein
MTPALYRYGRAGYAWAARLAGLGQVGLIPIGLLAVNVVSVVTLGWIAGAHRDRWGLRSLLLVAGPGALIATASDTAEASGLALAAIAAVASMRAGVFAGLILGLVRPDFATVVFLRRAEVIPVGAAVAAGAVGIRLLGTVGFGLDWAGSDGTITVPLLGYLDVWSEQTAGSRTITLVLLATAIATVAWGLTREHGWRRVGFVTTGVFLLMFSPKVLLFPVNSLRAAAALSLLWAIPRSAPPGKADRGTRAAAPPLGTL